MEKIYNKLVRDEIPEYLAEKGIVSEWKKISGEEKVQALQKKLQEEVTELLEARTREEKIGELVDVFEVLDSLEKEVTISIKEFEGLLKILRGGTDSGNLSTIPQILQAFAKQENISFEEIEKHRKQKYDERGGFEKGIFLVSTWEINT